MGKMNVDLITVSLQCSVEGFFFLVCYTDWHNVVLFLFI